MLDLKSLVSKLMYTYSGQVALAVVLGMGMAGLFKKSCEGGRCVVVYGPDTSEINRTIYRVGEKCYRFKPKVAECPV